MKIFKNIPLSYFSNYKIGGPVSYLFLAESEEDLKQALLFAKEKNLNFFILGEGTNVLFPDKGIKGVVIKVKIEGIKKKENEVEVGAGERMENLLRYTIVNSLSGLEWAGGLPGSVGGAVRMNAGCFGFEIKDVVTKVKALDLDSLEEKEFEREDLKFDYRFSRFQERKEIVISATFVLKPGIKREIKKKIEEKIFYRKERHPLEYPNCGSFFKNVPVEDFQPEILKLFEDKIKTDPFPVVPTAVLIDKAGLKGYKIGGAMVSEKHPAFLINYHQAKAKDILTLRDYVKKVVFEKFGVELKEEVEILESEE